MTCGDSEVPAALASQPEPMHKALGTAHRTQTCRTRIGKEATVHDVAWSHWFTSPTWHRLDLSAYLLRRVQNLNLFGVVRENDKRSCHLSDHCSRFKEIQCRHFSKRTRIVQPTTIYLWQFHACLIIISFNTKLEELTDTWIQLIHILLLALLSMFTWTFSPHYHILTPLAALNQPYLTIGATSDWNTAHLMPRLLSLVRGRQMWRDAQ
jgi:hypothetical protein